MNLRRWFSLLNLLIITCVGISGVRASPDLSPAKPIFENIFVGQHNRREGWALPGMKIAARPDEVGIREEVPPKYREKFAKWKSDLLSTRFGREQWETYANHQNFLLTIKVSGK